MPSSATQSSTGTSKPRTVCEEVFSASASHCSAKLFSESPQPQSGRSIMPHISYCFMHIWRFHDFFPLRENHLTLIIHHIIITKKLFTDFKIMRLSFGLGFFHSFVDQGCVIASPSSRPSFWSIPSSFSEPKIRIRSSSNDKRILRRGSPDGRSGRAAGYQSGGIHVVLCPTYSPPAASAFVFSSSILALMVAALASSTGRLYLWLLQQRAYQGCRPAGYRYHGPPYWSRWSRPPAHRQAR